MQEEAQVHILFPGGQLVQILICRCKAESMALKYFPSNWGQVCGSHMGTWDLRAGFADISASCSLSLFNWHRKNWHTCFQATLSQSKKETINRYTQQARAQGWSGCWWRPCSRGGSSGAFMRVEGSLRLAAATGTKAKASRKWGHWVLAKVEAVRPWSIWRLAGRVVSGRLSQWQLRWGSQNAPRMEEKDAFRSLWGWAHLCMSLMRCLFRSFAHFFKLGCLFSCWVYIVLCILWVRILYWMCLWQLFLSVCGLSFLFLDIILHRI